MLSADCTVTGIKNICRKQITFDTTKLYFYVSISITFSLYSFWLRGLRFCHFHVETLDEPRCRRSPSLKLGLWGPRYAPLLKYPQTKRSFCFKSVIQSATPPEFLGVVFAERKSHHAQNKFIVYINIVLIFLWCNKTLHKTSLKFDGNSRWKRFSSCIECKRDKF